ncbi:hypothetical protein AWC00_18915 [Mycobacterium conspicuum]|nr:hypothetical protein AWC00_18915 [Mycobacterium conspicuum]
MHDHREVSRVGGAAENFDWRTIVETCVRAEQPGPSSFVVVCINKHSHDFVALSQPTFGYVMWFRAAYSRVSADLFCIGKSCEGCGDSLSDRFLQVAGDFTNWACRCIAIELLGGTRC